MKKSTGMRPDHAERMEEERKAEEVPSTLAVAGAIGCLSPASNGDRPMERFKDLGPMGLSDAELLSILIGRGDGSAIDLCRELLSHGKNNLVELGRLSLHSIAGVRGIGMDRAVLLGAAFELGRRRLATEQLHKPTLNDSAAVARYLQARFRDHNHEIFSVVFMNRANRVIHMEIVSSGGLTGTVADPRIIIRKALEVEALGLILCHNHPSGNLMPSPSDEQLTYKLRDACRLFDIRVLDHVIVSSDGYYSFSDEGLL
jgi:DNA repair protein RadC